MKRNSALLAITVLSVGLLTSCGQTAGNTKDVSSEPSSESPSETSSKASSEDSAATDAESDISYSDYVTLGEYKGLEVSKVKTEIDDDALQEEIQYVIEENAEYTEITDRACENGDLVNIDFTGYVDGEEIDGYSAEDYEMTIGEGYFIEELETDLIGMETGETKDFTFTFDEDYYEESLAGQEATFTITLNSIYEVTYPEYNDAFVAGISDFTSTEDYEADLYNTLYEDAEDSNNYSAGYDALYLAIENAEISGYPEDLYNSCLASYNAQLEMYAELFGVDVSELEMSDEDIAEAVGEMVNERMVVQEIANQEGLTVTDEEYDEYVQESADSYGYESVADYEADYSKADTVFEILEEKVMNFLLENATITEVSEDEYYEDLYDDDSLEEDETVEAFDNVTGDAEEIIVDELTEVTEDSTSVSE